MFYLSTNATKQLSNVYSTYITEIEIRLTCLHYLNQTTDKKNATSVLTFW